MSTVDQIVAAINGHRYSWHTEDDLQVALARVLDDAGLHPQREVRLSRADRIDLLCGDVGIEVKVSRQGSRQNPLRVTAQLQRYAAHDQIAHLVLVSSRPITVPPTINGKTVTRLQVRGTW